MGGDRAAASARAAGGPGLEKLLEQYGCGPIQFTGTNDALYDRHLMFDAVMDRAGVGSRERYEAAARAVRDVLSQRWVLTERTYERLNPKRVYYLSMEFLIGRSLGNNVMNLLLDPLAKRVAASKALDWIGLLEEEPDAGLGNGGLGRLAACFVESMATMQLPAMGYGLRYEYGIFKQTIRDGWQHEQPDNWLRRPDPWEVARPEEQVEVTLGCSFEVRGGTLRVVAGRPSSLLGVPFDRPVVGYGGRTINTLRLWAAAAPDVFDFQAFSAGEFVSAIAERLTAESVTRVLYPDDSTAMGQGLRFVQEYFLVACSLADLVRRFRRSNVQWSALPAKVAIQLAYHLAKVIIKLLNNLAGAIDGDPAVRGRLRLVFLPEYCVSMAERLIPATEVSNQISTAGYEASGTSNMKFMMNGALTIGTRDGATIEMAEAAGEENFFLFGLTAEQVAGSRGWYSPWWHYDNEPETRAALNLLFSNHFSRYEPGVFEPLLETLLTNGDHYMHLADLASYLEADRRLCELYADPDAWTRMAILNIAGSGGFSSDRTIAQYAAEIWDVEPCPVP